MKIPDAVFEAFERNELTYEQMSLWVALTSLRSRDYQLSVDGENGEEAGLAAYTQRPLDEILVDLDHLENIGLLVREKGKPMFPVLKEDWVSTVENGGESGLITATCNLCRRSFDFLAGDPNVEPPRLCPECTQEQN